MTWPWSEIFIACHGQTEWNIAGRRQGRLDSPLTRQGVADAHRVASLAQPLRLDAIYTSPTGRAARTAAIVGEAVALAPVSVDGLAEIDIGAFSGMTDDEIERRTPGELAARAADKFHWRFPDGESYADADRRAATVLAELAELPTQRLLLVTHQMFGRALERNLLGLEPNDALELSIAHGTIVHLDPAAGTRTVLSV